jgi:murein DD-endopeptidase MepM/ murein hydrolase activator NlpD
MAVVLLTLLSRISKKSGSEVVIWSRSSASQDNSTRALASPSPSVEASPDIPAPVSPTPNTITPSPIPNDTSPNNFIIPVAGVPPEQLRDTFSDSRAAGRVHDAIDIPATLGTPVLAATDGQIVKLFHSEPGGTTIYQLSTDNRFVYYYAHLDRYAEGLTEGHFAKQGEVIAYVGDSGNAGAGNYHLHFSIALISDPKHYWQGVNINPYPLLKR